MRLSIIVPVYNVEKFLDDCITSVLRQTLPDWELILVDDGSTDKSGILCDEYARLDSRILVIHQQNMGQPHARNVGLEASHGEYIYYLDSDDIIWKDSTFAELFIRLCEKKPEVIFARLQFFQDTPDKILRVYPKYHHDGYCEMSGEAMLMELLQRFSPALTSPVDKLFRRNWLMEHDIRFPVDLRWHEEDEWAPQLILYACRYYFYNEILCSIRFLREGSVTAMIDDHSLVKKTYTKGLLCSRSCEFFTVNTNDRKLQDLVYRYYLGLFMFGISDYRKLRNVECRREMIQVVRKFGGIFKFGLQTTRWPLKILYWIYRLFGTNIAILAITRRWKG